MAKKVKVATESPGKVAANGGEANPRAEVVGSATRLTTWGGAAVDYAWNTHRLWYRA